MRVLRDGTPTIGRGAIVGAGARIGYDEVIRPERSFRAGVPEKAPNSRFVDLVIVGCQRLAFVSSVAPRLSSYRWLRSYAVWPRAWVNPESRRLMRFPGME